MPTAAAELKRRSQAAAPNIEVEVFYDGERPLYAAVGLRYLVPLSRLPVISHALEFGYRTFARNRLKWTGRCDSESAACRTS